MSAEGSISSSLRPRRAPQADHESDPDREAGRYTQHGYPSGYQPQPPLLPPTPSQSPTNPGPVTTPSLESSLGRRRVYIACLNCRKRKIKCLSENSDPCARCIKMGLHCEYLPVADESIHQSLPPFSPYPNPTWQLPRTADFANLQPAFSLFSDFVIPSTKSLPSSSAPVSKPSYFHASQPPPPHLFNPLRSHPGHPP
ncbi:hypothetical protein B0H17DRAFT_111079 [Mycena rosella]|uniref:Zn(2)-C6 fungal-type domain-containing protein n=1 Tax=Mycena rosella TaxID=1033263 RepID=A0AAD7D484_MYCRO|nr:hypothetical protein B0H17DRAFT_111079 [Mycena rosella]